MSNSNFDISIVITAHREGIILHKTVLSILESAKQLEDHNKTYEIILSLDNPDEATKNYVKRWSKDKRFVITEGSFGNPADNRNSAIKKAQGKYVAILDGDDLISENWLITALKTLLAQKSKPTIVRPEVHLQFGYEEHNCTAWIMRNSSSKDVDAIQMSYWNLWTNCLFTTKDILVNNPYRKPVDGFGFEDYLFCTETIAKGIQNIIAPGTVLFYRKRSFSVSTLHANTILDYSDLFDIEYIKNIKIPVTSSATPSFQQKAKHNFKRLYRFTFDTAKKIEPINKVMSPVARDIIYKNKLQKIPNWLVEKWKNINKIENQLWPTKGQIAKLEFHPLSLNPYENSFGIIYHELCKQISGNKIDYLFLAPAMSGRGGTEKLITNYIKALKKAHPKWNIAILSTQPYNDLTIDYFKQLDVDMLDFGSLTRGIGNYEKNIIWSRLLIQSKVKRLHIVNDNYWYHWIANHQQLLIKNNYKINISLFMREFTHEKGRIQSFADPDLMEIWPTVNKVFTDNQRVITDALKNNSFDENKIIVHYQPEESTETTEPKLIDNKKPIRVLWASRIAFQKRPDLLKEIVAKLDDNFVVDAYGIIEKKQFSESYFNDSKINYKGGFNGIRSINTKNYDLYLYTSQTDGVANILMEVSAAGLPIISSDAGGISEFVKDKKTGLLVDIEDIDGYVTALNDLKNNPAEAQKLAQESQKLLNTQHSWEKFIESVKKDIR
ncbi:glycosyltransferase [Candidatus Saccharibacteria bacterium]|nr:glycosyltransferase [Candidatus Saccharibacteria bacterium]